MSFALNMIGQSGKRVGKYKGFPTVTKFRELWSRNGLTYKARVFLHTHTILFHPSISHTL